MKAIITTRGPGKRLYKGTHDEPVVKTDPAVWDFFHRIRGKRLAPMIRENLHALALEFLIPPEVQAKRARVSSSTVERMLGRERKRHKARGRSSTKPGTPLKHHISVRALRQGNDKKPGFCEIDTVSYDGGFVSGEYAFTLSRAKAFTFRIRRNTGTQD